MLCKSAARATQSCSYATLTHLVEVEENLSSVYFIPLQPYSLIQQQLGTKWLQRGLFSNMNNANLNAEAKI